MQVNLQILTELLIASRRPLKSPEILLILLTCPLVQEDSSIMNVALPLAVVIEDLSEKTLETLSKKLLDLNWIFMFQIKV